MKLRPLTMYMVYGGLCAKYERFSNKLTSV